jgi:hypothetical protein
MSFAIASLIELPSYYTSDVEQQGLPTAVQRFRREIAAAEALIFAVPDTRRVEECARMVVASADPPANGKPCSVRS